MEQIAARIARRPFQLDSDGVQRSLGGHLPEPLVDHFVVIGGRRWPPKQVISAATGLDRADFTTHQARQILSRLGFTVGRRSAKDDLVEGPTNSRWGPHGGREADALRPYIGKWVAQRGLEVLVAADSPREVLAWLEKHNQNADGMFRVPVGPHEAEGLAPS